MHKADMSTLNGMGISYIVCFLNFFRMISYIHVLLLLSFGNMRNGGKSSSLHSGRGCPTHTFQPRPPEWHGSFQSHCLNLFLFSSVNHEAFFISSCFQTHHQPSRPGTHLDFKIGKLNETTLVRVTNLLAVTILTPIVHLPAQHGNSWWQSLAIIMRNHWNGPEFIN